MVEDSNYNAATVFPRKPISRAGRPSRALQGLPGPSRAGLQVPAGLGGTRGRPCAVRCSAVCLQAACCGQPRGPPWCYCCELFQRRVGRSGAIREPSPPPPSLVGPAGQAGPIVCTAQVIVIDNGSVLVIVKAQPARPANYPPGSLVAVRWLAWSREPRRERQQLLWQPLQCRRRCAPLPPLCLRGSLQPAAPSDWGPVPGRGSDLQRGLWWHSLPHIDTPIKTLLAWLCSAASEYKIILIRDGPGRAWTGTAFVSIGPGPDGSLAIALLGTWHLTSHHSDVLSTTTGPAILVAREPFNAKSSLTQLPAPPRLAV